MVNDDNEGRKKGSNQKHNAELQKKKLVDSQLSSVMNRKCYLIAFSIILLAVGYPILLSIFFARSSKDDSSFPDSEQSYFTDCADFYSQNYRADGIYEIYPNKFTRINVYCNMTAGGWTVLFRRDKIPDTIEFQHPIKTYKYGFGDLNTNHFLGLDNIHLLSKVKNRQLMVVVDSRYYRYNRFYLTDEIYNYKIIVDDEIDSFYDGASFLRLNNTRFSTIDVDFDLALNSNCSSAWKAGWWFTNCFDYSICSTCMILHGKSGVTHLQHAALMIK